jgi:hypothetical protein
MTPIGRGKNIWIYLLLILALLGLAGFVALTVFSPQEERVVTRPVEIPPAPESQPESVPSSPADSAALKDMSPEQTCAEIENTVAEFFAYLDEQTYLQDLDPQIDTQQRFQQILEDLASRPPIPAGEGLDPRLTVENVYHLYRVLGNQDLRLIKAIIRREQDTLELNLHVFFEWLNVEGRCGTSQQLRLPLEVMYRYAGFFLNSIGGRAYLFRRTPKLRLLVSYYCLLILHQADQTGRNTYGIDALPLIAPLMEELQRYPDLYFHDEYLARLRQMEAYYLARR